MPTANQNLASIAHFLLTYGGLILMGLLALWTFWPEDKPKPRRNVSQRYKASQSRISPNASKLKSLLHGDIKQADRILASLRKRYPGKSEQWIYEKAVLDLERDRRY